MWSNGADTNEDGEPILLLQPITSSKHKKKKCNPSPSSSHIGGSPCFYSNDVSPLKVAESIICTVCNEPMHLLLQLNAPLDDLERTLYVFGCNRPSCHVSAEDSEDCGGGNRFRINFDRLAAIRCFRSQQPFVKSGQKQQVEINSESTPVSEKLEDNDWGNDNDWGTDDPNDDNDWGAASTTVAASNEVSMDDLEAMLSKAELQSKASTGAQPSKSIQSKASTSNNATNVADDIVPSFQRYNLEMFNEPPSTKLVHSDEDDDDDDDEMVSDNNIDSSKVNQMLSKYLDMEEDEEILSALKGSGGTQSAGGTAPRGGAGVDVGERYERLPPEERAFLAFSKRLKRAPLQVVRYAYGGVPLWSM
jgi:pre-rRNA-processing protein TSR4